MNKSFYKFVTDFGPLLVFFTFYYKNEKNLEIAIPPFILATLLALVIVWKIEKKIPLKMVKRSLYKRTLMDKKRKNSPLIKVKDSILIKTDKLTKKQVLTKMSYYIDKLN